MQYGEFIGSVQNKARLSSRGDAVKATKATLETLAERITPEEREHTAAQLPDEIAMFMFVGKDIEKFSIDEFFNRITDREGVRKQDAVFHARAVLDVLQDAITKGQGEDVKSQLPEEFRKVFESGSEGKLEFD